MERFAFELIDYEWEAGAEVYERHDDVTLLWRAEPFRLEVAGRIGDSQIENFGQLMLLPPHIPLQSHGPTRMAGSSQVLACRFNPKWLSEIFGMNPSAIREDLCISMTNPHIAYAMRRSWSALVSPSFAGAFLAEGLAMTIAADLARHLSAGEKLGRTGGTLTRRQLVLITEYLCEDANWPPTVSDLAAVVNLSETHFRRLFKATVGETIHTYVERIRLDRAKHLLSSTRLPLKIISYRLGFAHPSAFSTAFTRLAGQSPKAFRRASSGSS
ncbi:AraC family transcriptional regulator [Sphingobium subterraneum]|uniref:AraC family transcriptional regulator n=2 Tax=Sphingobium subterraneum TaxID=627688 RepID=A0A841J3P7_9SPHN|nr:AraC family transcriptional regulator [Sphingobium subterraneum]